MLTVPKGYSLIEVAIILAILTIIGSIIAQRLPQTTLESQKAAATTLREQLQNASATYATEQMHAPDHGFSDFVTAGSAVPPYTISIGTVGKGGCKVVSDNLIDCSKAFSELSRVTYQWANGTITSTIYTPEEIQSHNEGFVSH